MNTNEGRHRHMAVAEALLAHATFGWDGNDQYRCRCGAPLGATGASWIDPTPPWAMHVAAVLDTHPPCSQAAAPANGEQVVHLWGFFDGDTELVADQASVCEGSVYDVYRAVAANVTHFDGVIANRRLWRDLDGRLRGVEFEAPASDGALRMWHRIFPATNPWLDPTTTHEAAPVAETRT